MGAPFIIILFSHYHRGLKLASLLIVRSLHQYHQLAMSTALALLGILVFGLMPTATAIFLLWLELALRDDP